MCTTARSASVMTSCSRSKVIPTAVADVLPSAISTGPGARTVLSLFVYVACSVRARMSVDSSRTSPVRTMVVNSLVAVASFAVAVKRDSPFFSSELIVMSTNLEDPLL